MKTTTIINVRQTENDYSAISEIIEKLQNFRYESNPLTMKEDTFFMDAIDALDIIRQRLFNEAKKTAIKYLKTA